MITIANVYLTISGLSSVEGMPQNKAAADTFRWEISWNKH